MAVSEDKEPELVTGVPQANEVVLDDSARQPVGEVGLRGSELSPSTTTRLDEPKPKKRNDQSDVETGPITPHIITEQQAQIIDLLNSTADPEILNKASLDTPIPLDEKVHISLGEKVDEIIRRRGLDLAKLIKDGGYSRLILLDASARPILGLAKTALSGGLSMSDRSLPQALFLNIGKEKIYRGLRQQPMPETIAEFKSQWPEKFTQQLTETLNRSHIPEAAKVLIVDDVRGTGASVELTRRILQWFRPDIEIDNFRLIDSQTDKDSLVTIYSRHIPWRKMQEDPAQSLVTDNLQDDDLTTFVSKPQEPEFQKKALEYRRRLYHYFKGLYKKSG